MLDFSKVRGFNRLTKEDVLENQQTIFEYYFGQAIEPKRRYLNPLRPGDKHPGCFFRWKSGLLFYDYSHQKTYDVFSFVEELYNCDFQEALLQIERDFQQGIIHTKRINKPFVRSDTEEKHRIQFTQRAFTNLDIKWWGDYLIDVNELKKNNIYSVEKLYIDSYKVIIPELCFAYYYPEIDAVKIYKPLERKEFKWYSNVPYRHIDGLKELPRVSNTVLVSKSKKDKIILQKIFTDVCATQGENYYAIPTWVDDYLNERYDEKICFFDCDKTGKEANKRLNERGYGWVNIDNHLYDCCGVKDPSDYVKEFKEFTYLNTLLKKKGIA